MRYRAVIVVCVAACGARSSIPGATTAAGAGGGASTSSAGAGGRICAPDCFIGHECCIGGCDGPPAVTPNDCCSCLAGEVDSEMCPGDMCAGTAATFPCGDAMTCKTGVEYCEEANGAIASFQCKPLPASCLPPNTADCGCMPVSADCGSCSGSAGQITESAGCG